MGGVWYICSIFVVINLCETLWEQLQRSLSFVNVHIVSCTFDLCHPRIWELLQIDLVFILHRLAPIQKVGRSGVFGGNFRIARITAQLVKIVDYCVKVDTPTHCGVVVFTRIDQVVLDEVRDSYVRKLVLDHLYGIFSCFASNMEPLDCLKRFKSLLFGCFSSDSRSSVQANQPAHSLWEKTCGDHGNFGAHIVSNQSNLPQLSPFHKSENVFSHFCVPHIPMMIWFAMISQIQQKNVSLCRNLII